MTQRTTSDEFRIWDFQRCWPQEQIFLVAGVWGGWHMPSFGADIYVQLLASGQLQPTLSPSCVSTSPVILPPHTQGYTCCKAETLNEMLERTRKGAPWSMRGVSLEKKNRVGKPNLNNGYCDRHQKAKCLEESHRPLPKNWSLAGHKTCSQLFSALAVFADSIV